MRKVIKGALIGGGVGTLIGGLLALLLWGLETGFRKDPPLEIRLFELGGSAAGSIIGAIAAATQLITGSLRRENFGHTTGN